MKICLIITEDVATNVKNVSENIAKIYNRNGHQVDCLVGDKSSLNEAFFDEIYETNLKTRLPTFWSILQYIRRHNPDVIMQLCVIEKQGIMAALAGKLTNTKTIVRMSGNKFKFWRWNYNSFVAKLLENLQKISYVSDKVVALSPFIKKQLTEHGCPSEKITVLPQPVDRNQFHPPKSEEKIKGEVGFGKKNNHILFVGRLSKAKGLPTLIRVAKELKQYQFHLLGEGPYKKIAKQLENVKAYGKIPPRKIHKYYQASDLYFHPSYLEGLPTVILEAKFCGLPVLARDACGMGWVADKTFSNSDQLPNLIESLIGKEPKPLPEIFKDNMLEERYKELVKGLEL